MSDQNSRKPHAWEHSIQPYVPTQASQAIRKICHQVTADILMTGKAGEIKLHLPPGGDYELPPMLQQSGRGLRVVESLDLFGEPLVLDFEDATPKLAAAPRRRQSTNNRWI